MADELEISTDHRGVRTLLLNRPAARNAINLDLQTALTSALTDAARDDAVRAIVLTGKHTAFCAGADLGRLGGDVDHTAFRFDSHDLTALVTLPERIEKPVVAAVNGVATGAGAQLALACDLRIASDRARFLSREGHIGLLPAHGGIARMVQLAGLGPARDFVLGGLDLDAHRACDLGLVTAVVPHDELMSAVNDHLDRIFTRSMDAYAVAKRVLGIAAGAPQATGMAAETLGQSLLVGTSEHRRRVAAASSSGDDTGGCAARRRSADAEQE